MARGKAPAVPSPAVRKGSKKPKREKVSGSGAVLMGDSGWTTVDVGDEVLLGATEGGFMGLEVLDGDLAFDFAAAAPELDAGDGEEPRATDASAAKEPDAKKKKRKRQQPKPAPAASAEAGSGGAEQGEQDKIAGGQDGGGQEEDLHARLQALEEENQRLRKRAKQDKAAAKKEARKHRKEEAKEKRVASKSERAQAKQGQQQAREEAQAEAARRVDVSAWDRFELDPRLMDVLATSGFSDPTPVQEQCLLPAIKGRCDVIGAAQTGSGKTLAFGLPILQRLLEERGGAEQEGGEEEEPLVGEGEEPQGGEEQGKEGGGEGQQQGKGPAKPPRKLRALILAPTRELALQVAEHLQRFAKPTGIWVVPLVGGISVQKQERMLSKAPEVVVATPGRLWDLMRGGHSHLCDMTGLSFLVLDEADHMVQVGHFKELSSILAMVPFPQRQAQQRKEQEKFAGKGGGAQSGRGKTKANQQQPQRRDGKGKRRDGKGSSGAPPDDDEDEEGMGQAFRIGGGIGASGEEGEEEEGKGGGGSSRGQKQMVQVFVFSATLTLPAVLRKRMKQGRGGSSGSSSLDSLMDTIPLRARPKIVDLTSERKLGSKVSESYLRCPAEGRDAYLYYLLAAHPGRTLVFTNAISAVRRLAALLKLLGLPVQALHAGMQQRQRLKFLDRFRASTDGVLVASDVAARGLDIPDVRCVIHYQLPASPDVYVHRSGRTARAGAEGLSIALVTPQDSGRFAALFRAFERELPQEFPVDERLMPQAAKRVRLAVRLDDIMRTGSKAAADNSWRRRTADQLGLALSEDEDEDDDEEGGGGPTHVSRKDQSQKQYRGPGDTAQIAALQSELSELLALPLAPKFSAKFFTGGAASSLLPGSSSDQQRQQAGGSGAAGNGHDDGQAPQAAAAAAAAVRSASRSVGAAAGGAGAGARGNRKGGAQQEPDAGRQQRQTNKPAKQQQQQQGEGKDGTAEGKKGLTAENKVKKKKGKAPATLAAVRAEALRAALSKRGIGPAGGGVAKGAGRRPKKGGGSLVVIPPAFGRESSGPDALQALRNRVAVLATPVE